MPPGCFIILFAFCAWKTRLISDLSLRKTLRTLAIIGAAGLYSLSIQPLTSLLAVGLERRYSVVQEGRFAASNAIIVLSAGLVEWSEGGVTGVAPNRTAIARLSEGIRLYRAITTVGKRCTLILTGGHLFVRHYSAAEVSSDWLVAMGIPRTDIVIETKARTTFEEARFALPLVKEVNSEALFLVTSAAHMPRSVATFVKFSMDVIPAPCDFTDAGRPGWQGFVPEAGKLEDNRRLLWEYLGSLFYRLKSVPTEVRIGHWSDK